MNDTFLKACRGEKVDYTPVWMMRQAGRYLPEYQAVRSKLTFLELCKTPELAAEVTIQPVDILGVDAAIPSGFCEKNLLKRCRSSVLPEPRSPVPPI